MNPSRETFRHAYVDIDMSGDRGLAIYSAANQCIHVSGWHSRIQMDYFINREADYVI